MSELLLRTGVPLIYLGFVTLTAIALLLARWVKSRGNIKLQASQLSPLGSLYTLTTAFLLSNVIFQFTNLRNAVTHEVVTVNKLVAVMSVLQPEQRIESRRLLYTYADKVAHTEVDDMLHGQSSQEARDSLERLRDFLASSNAIQPQGQMITPESANYIRKASDFCFDLIDSRERRLSLSNQAFQIRLTFAIALMYFALALMVFLVNSGSWTITWAAIVLLLSAPVPVILLFIYSNPIAYNLINITSIFESIMERIQ